MKYLDNLYEIDHPMKSNHILSSLLKGPVGKANAIDRVLCDSKQYNAAIAFPCIGSYRLSSSVAFSLSCSSAFNNSNGISTSGW